ncbi:MAG TPA: phosphohistidine phosphatase SixA [Thermoanaerobaculia bacterium]|nr:phosphohistidine phosphatase SixA [Thermoanaerobaculia bacterium]HQR67018.1 phosphohistidine phosphatase SixA [Thermoanaerobaculia bacterium]
MRIHLLRHAEAEDASPTGRDADRRLTEAGRKRMRLVARAISGMEPAYDAILVSPLVRARQTAEPVADACGFKGELLETRALLPGADPETVLRELTRLGAGNVLLVGHEPHLGRLFGRLVSGRKELEVPMKKAGLAEFETEGDPSLGRAELKFYLPPRLLEQLA